MLGTYVIVADPEHLLKGPEGAHDHATSRKLAVPPPHRCGPRRFAPQVPHCIVGGGVDLPTPIRCSEWRAVPGRKRCGRGGPRVRC